jgi:DNA-binding transcriptional ArsR family regulator
MNVMDAGPLGSKALDDAFFALSDPTRRAILTRLASGEATVRELTEPFALSQPAISRHLKVLEQAGLIRRGRDAQRRPAILEPQPVLEVLAWIENYRKQWERTYQRLDAALAQERKKR